MIDKCLDVYKNLNIQIVNDPLFDIIAPLTNNPNMLVQIKQQLEKLDQQRYLTWKTSLPYLEPYLV